LTNTGTVDIQKSTGSGTTALIIGSSGNYTQTGGTTTVDGKLTTAGAINISGGFLYGNLGTLTGNLDLTGGTINPGDGIKKIGVLNITGTYAESGAGILNIDLDGSTVGKFDVLNVSGAATLSGELNVDALTGFTLAAGDSFDIMNYSSETGTFTTTNLPALTGGDTWNINYAGNGGTELILTVEPPVAPAAKGTVSGAPATRVSRSAGAVTSTTTHEPSAILAKATCFGSRLFGSESCGRETAATVASVGEVHAASGGGVVHNNFMVATHSISAARGTASRETAVSASAMAKLYVCAYFPASVGHTMGCN
jgi:hypothetical protein